MTNKIQLSGIFSEGYGFIPKLLMKAKDISSNTKLVLCYLLSYTGAGIHCFPNMRDMADDLNLSTRTIVRCIKEANSNGYININKKHLGQGKGSSNAYTLLFMGTFGKNASDKNARANIARETQSIASDKNDTLQVTPVILNSNMNNNIKSNNNSDFIAFRDLFFSLYTNKFNKQPMFDGIEGKAIKNVLKKVSLAEAEILLKKYFNSDDDFYIKQGYTLCYFQKAMAGLRLENKPKLSRQQQEWKKLHPEDFQ